MLAKPPETVSKDERQNLGKTPTLAFLYGMQPKTYVETVWRDSQMVVSLAEGEPLAGRILLALARDRPLAPAGRAAHPGAGLRRDGAGADAPATGRDR